MVGARSAKIAVIRPFTAKEWILLIWGDFDVRVAHFNRGSRKP